MSTPPPPPQPGGPYGEQPYGGGHSGEQPYGGGPYGGQPPGGQDGGYPPYGHQPYQQPQPGGDDRTIAVLAHLSPLIALIFSAGMLSFLGPLIVWFVWRDRSPLIRNAAVSAFNFNVTVWVASAIAWICVFTVILIPLSIVLWVGAFIVQLVLSIKGAMSASRGEVYRYPLQVPILS
ncbi:hypothetical protein SAMN05216184_11815 [Georgenia satyanarayanai]|uniref:DUF4870 domain-containing protein n=1 Tax=Georgenia satyanarayanai TaxID=860221 RepID=A0A2Y9AQX7_9MICO|nr:DUF4870 domain-containing protein [Georgenia satyanarayanai]PYF96724.1 hypothetical protein A8987_11815 [Georgenia satyanarayanai]SSA46465.1 hypothetical protein SAMN05216184_11815 [Georgenia satyanarayanai]